MDHQSEIEKKKYRNWVRGGLAYKYLKQGLECFADDVVKEEHNRILAAVIHTPGNNCNHCCLRNLQPLHTCKRDHTGRKTCPYGLFNCNCLHGKKQRCPANICDGIMEEILKSHGSSPPQPCWQNTDIQKWCTEPWEVAKCYINAPGYSDKTNAADIDISGLLHVFINNINLHSHFACSMTGSSANIFIKTRGRRNLIFHSSSMEMEDKQLNECVDDIIAILEDNKELLTRKDAQHAIIKLRQLKSENFLITTFNEMEVCREALGTIKIRTEELNKLIKDTKEDIDMKQADASKAIDDKMQTALQDAVEALENNSEIKKLELAMKLLNAKVDNSETDLKQRLSQIENDITALKNACNQQRTNERLAYLTDKHQLQDKLVNYYQTYSVKTALSPLKQQKDSINVKDLYVPPLIEIIEEDRSSERDKDKTQIKEKKYIEGYHEIFLTKKQQHKRIYILGDVGTGKSTFCKMMIENWCNAVTRATNGSLCGGKDHERNDSVSSDTNMALKCDEDVKFIEKYEFLFFIPLQYMSCFKSDATVDMIKELIKDLTLNTELIDRIFQEDSGRCLIIADSLDEWRPSEEIVRKPHVSYGIPNGDKAKQATVITLSRPSARGMLNLKNSEVDHKLQLLGISSISLKSFIELYISKVSNESTKSYNEFINIIEGKQIRHVEKTPLLLQQLLWLYCNDMDIGVSVSETYCQILNAICGWSDHKINRNDGHNSKSDVTVDNNLLLPTIFKQYPRFDGKERVLYLCGEIAFEMLTSASGSIHKTFGRRNLLRIGLSNVDISELTQFGILNETNRVDTTREDTQYSFIHMSYLEFFAALYVTTHDKMRTTTSFQDKEDGKKDQALDKLFGKCSSVSDVLQLSNVFKLSCGMSAVLLGDLSERISCIVNEDKCISQSRRNGGTTKIFQIQSIMINCLKECGSDNTTMISLNDLVIAETYVPIPLLRRIKPNDVISLSIDLNENCRELVDGNNHVQYIKDIVEYTNQCKHVQYMRIFQNYENIPFSFAEHVSLEKLTLEGVKDYCINLPRHNQLQELNLIECENIHVSHLSTEQLEIVYISSVQGNLTSLISVLQLAPLKQLILNDLEIKHLDLSRYNHLENLTLEGCPGLEIMLLNTEHLEQLYIGINGDEFYSSFSSSNFSKPVLKFNHSSNVSKLDTVHLEDIAVDLASLVSLLQQAPLRELTLIRVSNAQLVEEHMRCENDAWCIDEGDITGGLSDDQYDVEVPMHVMDLSSHNKLRELTMIHSSQIQISYMNTEQLEQVYIDSRSTVLSDTRKPALEFNILSNISKLTELRLKGVKAKTASLVSLIQLAPLTQLTLIDISADWSVDVSHMHGTYLHVPEVPSVVLGIDLSKQNELRKLEMKQCRQLKLSNINTERLEKVYIENSNLDFNFNVQVLDHNLLSYTSKPVVMHLKYLTCNKTSLVSLLQLTNLSHLTLTHVSGGQSAAESQMDVIHVDLSKQNQLQFLDLSNCRNIRISNLNTDKLKKVNIIDCPTILEFDLLSNASKLTSLNVADNIGELTSISSAVQAGPSELTFDTLLHDKSFYYWSGMSPLQKYELVKCCIGEYQGNPGYGYCNRKLVYIDKSLSHYSNIPVLKYFFQSNANKLIELELVNLTCDIISLVSLLQQTYLRKLTLTRVFCDQSDVKGYLHVDLSKQNKLQILELHDCKNVTISELNTEKLMNVHIEQYAGSFDFNLLSNAKRLTDVHVESETCDVTSLPSVIQLAFRRQRTIYNVQCDQNDEHDIDMPSHSHLQSSVPTKCFVDVVVKTSSNDLLYPRFIYTDRRHSANVPVLDIKLTIFSYDASSLIELQLGYLTIDISLLVSSLQQNTLSHLTLTSVYGDQSAVEGNIHEKLVDLSKQNQLQVLKLSQCKNITISDINTDMLERVHIENCADVLKADILSNASKLVEIHFIDVTCNKALVLLLQTVTSRQLELKKVSADQSIVESDIHVVRVDLSKQSQLQVLKLSHCKNITISDLNTEELENVFIEHCPGILDIGRLLNARKLTKLYLRGGNDGNTFQYSKQIDDVMHTLHQLKKLTLHDVHIDDNALTVSSEMKSLEGISLYKNAEMSLYTWYTFIDSLLVLHQSVNVTTDDNTQEQKRDYVKMNPNFKVVWDDDFFRFESRAERKNSK